MDVSPAALNSAISRAAVLVDMPNPGKSPRESDKAKILHMASYMNCPKPEAVLRHQSGLERNPLILLFARTGDRDAFVAKYNYRRSYDDAGQLKITTASGARKELTEDEIETLKNGFVLPEPRQPQNRLPLLKLTNVVAEQIIANLELIDIVMLASCSTKCFNWVKRANRTNKSIKPKKLRFKSLLGMKHYWRIGCYNQTSRKGLFFIITTDNSQTMNEGMMPFKCAGIDMKFRHSCEHYRDAVQCITLDGEKTAIKVLEWFASLINTPVGKITLDMERVTPTFQLHKCSTLVNVPELHFDGENLMTDPILCLVKDRAAQQKKTNFDDLVVNNGRELTFEALHSIISFGIAVVENNYTVDQIYAYLTGIPRGDPKRRTVQIGTSHLFKEEISELKKRLNLKPFGPDFSQWTIRHYFEENDWSDELFWISKEGEKEKPKGNKVFVIRFRETEEQTEALLMAHYEFYDEDMYSDDFDDYDSEEGEIERDSKFRIKSMISI